MLDQFQVLIDNWPSILSGLGLTAVTWILSVLFGALAGLVLAIIRLRSGTTIRLAIDGYVGLIRGTPLLIQLFLLYYGGPFVGISLSALVAGVVGLSVYAAAYYAEIFRAGFEAVPKGQVEAAAMAGLSQRQTIFRVMLPQTMLIILPSLTNMATVMIKETAILSVITVSELTATLSNIGSVNFTYVPTLTSLALFYWGSLELISLLGRRAERHSRRFLTTWEN